MVTFPGDGGSDADNVNRWRQQIGLPAVDGRRSIHDSPVQVQTRHHLFPRSTWPARTARVTRRMDAARWPHLVFQAHRPSSRGGTGEVEVREVSPIRPILTKMLRKIVDLITSLKLTIVCLAAAMVLIFAGTIAQVHLGIHEAQQRYFQSLFVWWPPEGRGFKIPIFPGGHLIGAVLLINLIAAHAKRFHWAWRKLGIHLTHAGLIIMLAGGLFTDLFAVESHMRLGEGDTKNYSENTALNGARRHRHDRSGIRSGYRDSRSVAAAKPDDRTSKFAISDHRQEFLSELAAPYGGRSGEAPPNRSPIRDRAHRSSWNRCLARPAWMIATW